LTIKVSSDEEEEENEKVTLNKSNKVIDTVKTEKLV
jgi:hypothetical protein